VQGQALRQGPREQAGDRLVVVERADRFTEPPDRGRLVVPGLDAPVRARQAELVDQAIDRREGAKGRERLLEAQELPLVAVFTAEELLEAAQSSSRSGITRQR